MIQIRKSELPPDALLQRYRNPSQFGESPSYTDCYSVRVPGRRSLPDFIIAFYTTWLFKLERQILRLAVNRPSIDDDARQLALGQTDSFAAWTLEDRNDEQILMCDFQGRTRSWMMVEALDDGAAASTLLRFGSAVVPLVDAESSTPSMPWTFKLLVPLHKLYSRALLRAAASRLNA